jgi:hypothetical protein
MALVGTVRLWDSLFGGGSAGAVVRLTGGRDPVARCDRRLVFLTSEPAKVYGWALSFGKVDEPFDMRIRANMCARCGGRHLTEWLPGQKAVLRCPACGARTRPAALV